MQDETEFRRAAEAAIETLKQHLIAREEEDDAGFEVEEQNGVLNVLFEEPPGKFVITPNSPVRQIWISALSTSFKLDLDVQMEQFILPRTGESFITLVDRLIGEHLVGA
jgi:iron donor protein CyaY